MPTIERLGDSPVLQTRGLSKLYRSGEAEVHALRDVSLSVCAGEIVAIVGPSGSGKSTLLNMLAGLDTPTDGEVRVAGEPMSRLSVPQRARLRRQSVGMVFQFFNLMPLLTARENVALPLLIAGASPRSAERRADELLAQVGLADRREHTPDQLSGGQMQRVAVARAVVARPAVVLADEPTGNLDSASGKEILELLRRTASEQGSALVMVTHDARAAAVANRTIELRDGAVYEERQTSPAAPLLRDLG